jgi:CheY-like chemotaxis protein
VLVIDDDGDVREALRAVLLDEDFKVALAPGGKEGLHYLLTHEAPGLILLDWMMGGMDGAACLVAFAREPRLAEIPVVLLTADGHARERGTTLGAVDFLKKPVDLEELLSAVRKYCQR